MKIKYISLYISIAVSLSFLTSCVIYVNPPEKIPDTTPPVVSINYPSSGNILGQNVQIVGSASDSSGIAKVFVTAAGLAYTNEITGLAGSGWSTSLIMGSPGNNTIRAWAVDKYNNTNSPISVSISNDFSLPSVAINYPVSSDNVYNSPITISGISSVNIGSIQSVQVIIDGVTNTASGTTSWSYPASISIGTHTVSAIAISTGNKTNVTPLISFTYHKAVWNIIVYMDGDNNLEDFALWNFNELENVSGLNNGKVNVIVLFDRSGNITKDNGGWVGARLYEIKYDPNFTDYNIRSKRLSALINGVQLTTTGNNEIINMADYHTLSNLVVWVSNNYSAQYTMLILWDHGDGWKTGSPLVNDPQSLFSSYVVPQDNLNQNRTIGTHSMKGICLDNNPAGPPMLNSEVKAALYGRGITVLGFDACLMGMLEAAADFKNTADYIIASPDLENAYGWNYDDWLARFCASSMTPEALIHNVIDSYHDYYVNLSQTTLAAYKMSNFGPMMRAFESYVSNLISDLSNSARATIQATNIIYQTEQYKDISVNFFHTDIWDLANHINLSGSDALKTAITNFVFYEWHHSSGDIFNDNPNSHGLAVYFGSFNWEPTYGSIIGTSHSLRPDYINSSGIFFSNSRWVTYLTNLYNLAP